MEMRMGDDALTTIFGLLPMSWQDRMAQDMYDQGEPAMYGFFGIKGDLITKMQAAMPTDANTLSSQFGISVKSAQWFIDNLNSYVGKPGSGAIPDIIKEVPWIIGGLAALIGVYVIVSTIGVMRK